MGMDEKRIPKIILEWKPTVKTKKIINQQNAQINSGLIYY